VQTQQGDEQLALQYAEDSYLHSNTRRLAQVRFVGSFARCSLAHDQGLNACLGNRPTHSSTLSTCTVPLSRIITAEVDHGVARAACTSRSLFRCSL
jgi:hypothetical protein